MRAPPLRCLPMMILAAAAQLQAAVHDLDPAKGATLEEAARRGLLQAGDTAVLRSGYHGDVSLDGDNASLITITAAPGQAPRLSRLVIDGSRWLVRGVVISPSFHATPYKGTIVKLGEGRASSDLTLADSFVFGGLDSSAWTVEQWMSANSGVQLGRHGTGLAVRNTHLLNLRFGIQLSAPQSLCEGNIVENFSADGMRVTRDDITVRGNVIRNIYVSSGDGDANHDDGIQAFLFNKGTGIVRRGRIIDNIIINREDPSQPYPASLQGIGFFDGPLVEFTVTGNAVDVDHWHGISLFDAQGCTVTGNSVFNSFTDRKTWIMLGQKLKQTKGNTVTGNSSLAYKIKSAGLTEKENAGITAAEFTAAQRKLLQRIDAEFGPRHPLTGLARAFGKSGNRVVVQGYEPFAPAKPAASQAKPNRR